MMEGQTYNHNKECTGIFQSRAMHYALLYMLICIYYAHHMPHHAICLCFHSNTILYPIISVPDNIIPCWLQYALSDVLKET